MRLYTYIERERERDATYMSSSPRMINQNLDTNTHKVVVNKPKSKSFVESMVRPIHRITVSNFPTNGWEINKKRSRHAKAKV